MQSTAAVTTSPDHRKQRRGKSDVHLDVANLTLSDDLLKGLIDDWIGPTLVRSYARMSVEPRAETADDKSQTTAA
ncbi:MAG TPA: hypothetical protein VN577_21915 [Terriglobales bacterium]|nr:hypothetical protein [Terriglobales bacterium]